MSANFLSVFVSGISYRPTGLSLLKWFSKKITFEYFLNFEEIPLNLNCIEILGLSFKGEYLYYQFFVDFVISFEIANVENVLLPTNPLYYIRSMYLCLKDLVHCREVL